MSNHFDLIVLGGGPAGYVAAIRAAQLGMSTVVFEKERLGGTCLNVGCIPTKTLFQSAETAEAVKAAGGYGVKAGFGGIDFGAVMGRKDRVVQQLVGGVQHLMKKNRITVVQGEARFDAPDRVVDGKTGTAYQGDNILIATGSVNAPPPIPGIDGRLVLDSTGILSLDKLPASLAVIGGGVIGCEFAGIFSAFGAKVTVIEKLPRLLPGLDESLGAAVASAFAGKGIEVLTGAAVIEIADSGAGKAVRCDQGGSKVTVKAELVLVATGRKPATGGLCLEAAGVKTDRGFVVVGDSMETNVQGIYAAGDVTGRSFLAHAAYEQGVVAVENMRGAGRKMEYRDIPSAVFVEPEVSSVGRSEAEARAAGYDVVVGRFGLAANGKALAMGRSGGFVKVVAESQHHEILGLHMAGPGATELVAAGASLLAMEAVLEDVEATIYPHPSVSEAIREACLDALGRAVHA